MSEKRRLVIPSEEIDDEYHEGGSARQLFTAREIVILLLTFSLTLDKSTGKLRLRPFFIIIFFFFGIIFFLSRLLSPAGLLARIIQPPRRSVAATKRQPRYRTSLNLKLKLISLSREVAAVRREFSRLPTFRPIHVIPTLFREINYAI